LSVFPFVPSEPCSWIRIWLLGCCFLKELGVQMFRVDRVVVCCTFSHPDCPVAGGCRSFTINPPSHLPDRCRRKDCGGLWLSSRGLVCAQVYLGGCDACCFGGLF